jgi:hypothetical protein
MIFIKLIALLVIVALSVIEGISFYRRLPFMFAYWKKFHIVLFVIAGILVDFTVISVIAKLTKLI